ncbi:AraC family transcriptional regulator [Tellurirhabdus rosea]|uniref:AraC family transcriptional regulator n=1 Tax=Tellurirhabdus rosea TaxID=2674997 RepID=UPI00225A92B7|nr:AraC family transcriptional regulator [Tellurirhabdus rosea]
MNVLASHLKNFTEYAQVRGVAVNPLLKSIDGLPPDPGSDTALIRTNDFYAVLETVHEKLGDPLWGIKAGNFISMKLLGLIYQISLQTTTLSEALHYLGSYLAATLPLVSASMQLTPERATVTLEILDGKAALNRVILENVCTIIAREIRMMSEQDPKLCLGSPFHDAHYPTGWSKSEAFAVSFEPGVLKAGMRSHARLHLELLVPQYLKMIEEVKPDSSFANRVKVTMLALSDPKLPDIRRLCETLCMTPRTLQRRLEAENVTFREVLEVLKKDLCSFLLRHEQYSIASISYILGYSEPAAFLHAFKKWFGTTPERMRHRFRSQPEEPLKELAM